MIKTTTSKQVLNTREIREPRFPAIRTLYEQFAAQTSSCAPTGRMVPLIELRLPGSVHHSPRVFLTSSNARF